MPAVNMTGGLADRENILRKRCWLFRNERVVSILGASIDLPARQLHSETFRGCQG
jgi:hypothetical protein